MPNITPVEFGFGLLVLIFLVTSLVAARNAKWEDPTLPEAMQVYDCDTKADDQ